GAMKLNSTLLKSTVVAALGGLLFGFDTAVIAGATQAVKVLYHLPPFWLGFTVASALVGTVIGSMVAGIPGDGYGRRTGWSGVAVEARCFGRARGALFLDASGNSGKSTLAGQEGANRRSQRSASPDGRREFRTGAQGNRRVHRRRARHERCALHREIPRSHLPGGFHWTVQPTLRNQR